MKKYNHAFAIGFSLESDNEGEQVTEQELFDGLESRIDDLKRNPNEIIEACGLPFDTYCISDYEA